MVGMSAAALARCRRLKIDYTARPGELHRAILSVWDPRLEKEVTQYDARTRQDVERVKRAFMARYRIPPQNVSVVSEEVGAPNDEPQQAEEKQEQDSQPEQVEKESSDDRTDEGPS